MFKKSDMQFGQSIMWKYVGEIKDLLSNNDYVSMVTAILKEIDVENLEEVLFVAHGSSYNVSVIASNWLEEFANIKTRCFTPMNFKYYFNTNPTYCKKKVLVIGISQTGTSRGTIEALECAGELGYRILTVTDIIDTPVANLGDYYLNIGCGEENSNAKTKGVCCTLMLLQTFAMELGLLKNVLDKEKYNSINKEIKLSINEMEDTIDNTMDWIKTNNFGVNIGEACFLGYGKNLGTMLEGTLKLIETMCIPATGTEIGEFSHGMHRYISNDSHLIIINTGGIGEDEAIKTYNYFNTRTDNCLLINATKDIINNENVINIPWKEFTESVLPIMLIFHILSVAIPEKNGIDPNGDANDEYTRFIDTRI